MLNVCTFWAVCFLILTLPRRNRPWGKGRSLHKLAKGPLTCKPWGEDDMIDTLQDEASRSLRSFLLFSPPFPSLLPGVRILLIPNPQKVSLVFKMIQYVTIGLTNTDIDRQDPHPQFPNFQISIVRGAFIHHPKIPRTGRCRPSAMAAGGLSLRPGQNGTVLLRKWGKLGFQDYSI